MYCSPSVAPLPQRGVRQGGVLNPTKFNNAVEHAMQEWKTKLGTEGFALDSDITKTLLTKRPHVLFWCFCSGFAEEKKINSGQDGGRPMFTRS